MIGIYKITNPSNKIYIGQSVNIEKRFGNYKNINKSTRQKKLNSSFRKYGIESHIFEIIEECTMDQLNIRERYWQDFYNVVSRSGLNCQLTKTEDSKFVFSEETINKLKKFKMGEAQRNKIILTQTGRTVSQSTREKLKANHGGSKIVLDTQTGIFYDSLAEAGRCFDIKSTTLGRQLTGQTKPKTSLIYV